MKKIDHYAILAKKSYKEEYYYLEGYKTLATLKKHFAAAKEKMKNKKHDKMILVARSYEKEIIKIYEEE